MEENKDISVPNPHFPTGKREIIMLIAMAVCCVLMADFIAFGGFNVGFALMSVAVSVLSYGYLHRSGCKGGAYAAALFVLTLVISASFLRSDDGFVKFIMVCFLLVSGNLTMVLTAGQNRRDPGGALSLLDAPMAVFSFGVGEMGNSFGGLNDARKNAGTVGKKNMAVLAGLAAAIPVMAVLIPLLMKADAAFEGLLNLLPKMDISEPFLALVLGVPLACVVYTRNTALKHRPKADRDTWTPRHFNALTVNTVLICVCLLYLVYLVSQLAYFVGGFSGILPEEFTMAEYARRGFFEMALLTAINLAIIVVSAALTEPNNGKLPGFTKGLCLFIGLVTLFFAATASAKMFLYIGGYGLTRLRLLVQAAIAFLALTVIFVAIWLCKPKFAYMKAVLLTAMILGAGIAWADVDTVVAAYNVGAYQSGKLEDLDIHHLQSLGSGAVPYLDKLVDDDDPYVASAARNELLERCRQSSGDARSWNIADAKAADILSGYKEYLAEIKQEEQAQEDARLSCPLTGLADYIDLTDGTGWLVKNYGDLPNEGGVLVYYLYDTTFFDRNMEPFDLCPFAYGTMLEMQKCGVQSIEITDTIVVFWPEDPSTALVWTYNPTAAVSYLGQSHADVSLHCVHDDWYVAILGSAK